LGEDSTNKLWGGALADKTEQTPVPLTDPSHEELRAGTRLSRYQVEELVATAGFSHVYRGVDTQTSGKVAIKVLRQRLARSRKGVARFQREFEALRNIDHANIVALLDHGETANRQPYLVMEWLEGSTLREFLRSGPLTLEEAMPIIDQLCAALTAAHKAGVIHRDLKASNVMIMGNTAPVQVKLVDFGIAKAIDGQQQTTVTTTGEAIGTPYSMAPEQVAGQQLDERTDVYALGVLMFEMLTGRKPFNADSALEVGDMHLRTPPPHAYELAPVSPAVDAVIQRCLAKHRDHRYETPAAVGAALHIAARKRSPVAAQISPQAHTVQAIGLHFEVRLAVPDDEVDDDVFEAMEDVLTRAQTACAAAGLRTAMSGGNSFLGVAALPDYVPSSMELRARIIKLAMTLARLTDEVGNSTKLRISVTLHRAPAVASSERAQGEFVGGELLSVSSWVCQDPTVSSVIATGNALEGVEDGYELEAVPGMPSHYRLLHPNSRR
jgi:serine/threonine-protein kinase